MWDEQTRRFIKTHDTGFASVKLVSQKFSPIGVLIIAVMAASAAFFTSALLFGNRTIYNGGNVNSIGVGVYWETDCLNNVSSINWGYMNPGTTQDVTVFIRNEGSVPMTLNMTVDNWDPVSASTYMTVSWNRQGHVVDSGFVAETVITLSVSQNVNNITSFSFDLTIIGSE